MEAAGGLRWYSQAVTGHGGARRALRRGPAQRQADLGLRQEYIRFVLNHLAVAVRGERGDLAE